MRADLNHIQRIEGTPPPRGNGGTLWKVRWYDGAGRRRAKNFADSKHESAEKALAAAVAFRDEALAAAALVRNERMVARYVPRLTGWERRRLRARMIDADMRGNNRYFRVRTAVGTGEPVQRFFFIRSLGSAQRAFRAALRFRDRIERLPLRERKERLCGG